MSYYPVHYWSQIRIVYRITYIVHSKYILVLFILVQRARMMTQKGCFWELIDIMVHIHRATPMSAYVCI